MRLKDKAKAYWNLWFPRIPESEAAVNSAFVVSFVKEHAQGNISLQSGKFLTHSAHDKMVKELEGYRFSS